MNVASLKNKNVIFQILKGILVAVCFSLIGILLFALSLRFFDMSDLGIKIVNQIIKTLSILSGCFVCLKADRKNGIVKGILISVLYTIVSFFLFSILNGEFSFSVSILFDLLFSFVVGAISGILCVNIFKY